MWIRIVIVSAVILGLVFLFTLSIRKCLSGVGEVVEIIGEVGLKNIVEEVWYGKEE